MPHFTDGGVSYRVEGNDANTPAGMQVQQALEPIVAQFVQGQRQLMLLGEMAQWSRALITPIGTIQYYCNNGQETVIITPIVPSSSGQTIQQPDPSWLIGSNDTTDLPFVWDGSVSTIDTLAGLHTKTYPNPGNLPTPPSLTVDSSKVPNPTAGTAVMTKALAGKQYWEVEIVALPQQVPPDVVQTPVPPATTFPLAGRQGGAISPNGVTEQSPVINQTVDQTTYRWPSELGTLQEPIIGVTQSTPEYGFYAGTNTTNWRGKTATRAIDWLAEMYVGVTPTSIMSGADDLNGWVYYGYYVGPDSSGQPSMAQTLICAPNPVDEANPADIPTAPSTTVFSAGDTVGVGSTVYYCTAGYLAVDPVSLATLDGVGPTSGPSGSDPGVSPFITAALAQIDAFITQYNAAVLAVGGFGLNVGTVIDSYSDWTTQANAAAAAAAADPTYTAARAACIAGTNRNTVQLPPRWLDLQSMYVTAYLATFPYGVPGGIGAEPQTYISVLANMIEGETVSYLDLPDFNTAAAALPGAFASYPVATASAWLGASYGFKSGNAWWTAYTVGQSASETPWSAHGGEVSYYASGMMPLKWAGNIPGGSMLPRPNGEDVQTNFYGDLWAQPNSGPTSYTTGNSSVVAIGVSLPDSTNPVTLGPIVVKDVVQVAFDASTGNIWFGKNNQWQGDPKGGNNPAMQLYMPYGPVYPSVTYRMGDVFVRMKFGNTQKYGPPSGFTALTEQPPSTIQL